MSIILRDYQEKAVTKAVESLRLAGNDLLVLATGAGKSIIIAEIAQQLNQDIMIFQPSKEIGLQNIEKMRQYVAASEIGVFSASMGRKDIRRYTFATIGSVYKYAQIFAHFGIFLIDEAHAVNVKDLGSMFSTFINQVNEIRLDADLPPVKIIGLTATPYRLTTGHHKDDRGQLYATATIKLINRMRSKYASECFWKRILVNVGIQDLIDRGYLVPLKYENRTFMTHEDMKLNKSGTEFDLDDFAVKLGTRQQQVVDCVLDCQTRYRSTLVFCPSVKAAETYAAVVPRSAAVSAKTPAKDRDRIGRQFKKGEIHTIFNMGVYTTGFDYPELDSIVLLRPTRSIALYMQMLGRGVRIFEDKEFCTVIDFTNTVEQLGPIEKVVLRKEKFPEFKFPMWELFTSNGNQEQRWHGKALYSYAIKPGAKNFFMNKAIAKKALRGK